MALGTVRSKNRNLQQLSIHIPSALSGIPPEWCFETEQEIEANPGMKWSDLDRLLVQLLESRSIRAAIVVHPSEEERKLTVRPMTVWAKYLLPESINSGFVELFEEP